MPQIGITTEHFRDKLELAYHNGGWPNMVAVAMELWEQQTKKYEGIIAYLEQFVTSRSITNLVMHQLPDGRVYISPEDSEMLLHFLTGEMHLGGTLILRGSVKPEDSMVIKFDHWYPKGVGSFVKEALYPLWMIARGAPGGDSLELCGVKLSMDTTAKVTGEMAYFWHVYNPRSPIGRFSQKDAKKRLNNLFDELVWPELEPKLVYNNATPAQIRQQRTDARKRLTETLMYRFQAMDKQLEKVGSIPTS